VSQFREDWAYTSTNLHSKAEAENEEIDQAGRRVLLAWLKFQKGLPEQASINLRDKPPTFAVLLAAVEAAQMNEHHQPSKQDLGKSVVASTTMSISRSQYPAMTSTSRSSPVPSEL